MRLDVVADPVEFRNRTRVLLADEARHNLIRGILASLIDDPQTYADFRLLIVESVDGPAACALITLPYRLVVADTPDESALTALVIGVEQVGFDIPGVIGNKPTVDQFAALWQSHTGQDAELAMAQGVFAAERIVPPRPTRGVGRVATETDFEVVYGWFNDFVDEALPDEPRDDERLRTNLRRRLRGETPGGIWVWQIDATTVSMSAHTPPTGAGVRINAVYTPRRHRSNGYASSLVAAQSQWLLDHGHEYCFLFTDLANPTSNRIYESIGYRRIAEAASYDFVNPAT